MASTVNHQPVQAADDGRAPLLQLLRMQLRTHLMLWIGLGAVVLPTLYRLATEVWATEQGSHGPIVFASGIWLLAQKLKDARGGGQGHSALVMTGVVAGAVAYVFGRMIGVIGIEVGAVAAILITLFYAFYGIQGIRAAWFPLLYLGFLIPLPDTIVALITQPMKLHISDWAARSLDFAGYPVANTGVTLQVAQYELLVATACSGLNALISLSAIGLFYVYLLHHSSWRYALLLMVFVIPAAIFANLIRVVILILLTYHMGDAAAQGFLHGVAGLATFVLALAFIIGVDTALTPIRRRLSHG